MNDSCMSIKSVAINITNSFFVLLFLFGDDLPFPSRSFQVQLMLVTDEKEKLTTDLADVNKRVSISIANQQCCAQIMAFFC